VTYRLRITPPARRELDEAFAWIARRSPHRARVWQVGALRAIRSLAEFPRRCPLAPEGDAADSEVRQLVYGDYRILFTIQGNVVRILRVRHGARRPVSPDDL
jgi:plasmid stabilization system protein ParE